MCYKRILALLPVLLALVMLLAVTCIEAAFRRESRVSLVKERRTAASEQARLFGGIIGTLISYIPWLPIEINMIDLITSAIAFFSDLLGSTAAAVSGASEE